MYFETVLGGGINENQKTFYPQKKTGLRASRKNGSEGSQDAYFGPHRLDGIGSRLRFTFDDNGDFTATGRLNGTLGNAQVRNAIALGGAGNLGTYAMLRKTSAGDANPGDEVAGSDLVYANADSASTSSPNGTWQCMGFADSSNGAESMTTLWLRVE